MSSKRHYLIDNQNRLIVKQKDKRLLPQGNFSVDKHNHLIYHLNEPFSWRRQYGSGKKICFLGNWRLNPNYDLEMILNKTNTQFAQDRLTLKGEIISVEKDSLIFETHSIDKYGQSHIQLIKLTGFWKADQYNRLCFVVKKETQPDILVFKGTWQINQNQKITYTYEKTDLKTQTKHLHTLVFEGFWEINERNRLTYILSKGIDSRFDFRVQMESPNLYPQDKAIRYRIGIGLRKQRYKIICLYGTWKFSKISSLLFLIDYGRNQLQAIEFGLVYNLTRKEQIEFLLTNKQKQPLGLSITFSRKLLRDSEAKGFLRLKDIEKDKSIEAGLRIPF
ncbi:MAG: hypothetical protein NC912_00895 [Candidatus Omnitrophica bacterium]|nr:hypothetical protein [Candidatus Omnitrophota bacterium]